MSVMQIREAAVRAHRPRERALSAAFALTCAVAPAIAAQSSPNLGAFDRYVARAAHDWRIPGLAIAVVKNDSLVFAKGYGVIEIGKPAPATEHTRFAIGSTTKAMTSAALAMLVDEGKLKWDDHVIDYLPDLRFYDPYATRELTVRDLLTHRTGLPGTDLLWAVPENSYSMPEMIRRLRYVKPSSSFRSHWEYQNVVYAIGGLLVERLSGMSWETFVRTRIFAPLQMTETIPLVSELRSKPNVAMPHDLTNDTVHTVAIRTTDAIASAGSVWSSVYDMSKWMRFILDSGRVGTKRLIRPETFTELVTPQMRAPREEYPALGLARPMFFSYALGWFVQEYHGHTIWMHTGSIDGMSAIIGLMSDRRVGVYVLANLDHAELRHALMYKVFDLYTASGSDSGRDWSADVKALFAAKRAAAAAAAAAAPKPSVGTHPSLPLDRYAGTYADSTYGTVTVTLANGILRARFGNWDIGELQPASYDGFRSRKTDPLQGITDVTFIPDGAGHISAVQLFGQAFPRATPSDGT